MKQPAILWADDDLDDIAIMRDVMFGIDNNHDIIEVDNGRKVLDYLHDAKQTNSFPCLIVLDMNMPILSGRDTLALIKSDPEFKNIPVVVFTTSNSNLDRLFCERYGVEMITKPVTYNSLKDTIQQLLSFCNTPLTYKPSK
jgi:CheY-like chemotaxis protein